MTTAKLTIEVDGKKAEKQVRKLETQLLGLEKTGNKVEKSNKKVSRGMKSMASAISPVNVGIAGLTTVFIASIAAAAKFEKSMAEISTLLSGDVESSMEVLNESVRELATEFGGDVTEQAKALYSVISAGASDAAEATEIMTVANKLAVGGVTDVATAADGLTSALNAYGAGADEATDYSDAMFVAMKQGKTTIGELSAGLGQVAPLASQVGVSFDEMLAATSAITTAGVKTSEAFTQVRSALVGVLKPSKEAQETAASLGISFDAQALKAKGLRGFLQDVSAAVGDNQETMAQLFPRVEALNAVLALTGGQAEKFGENMEAMNEKTGASEEAFGKMVETFDYQWNVLIANIKDVAIALGEVLLPVITDVLRGINRLFETTEQHMQRLETIGEQQAATAKARLEDQIAAGIHTASQAMGAYQVQLEAIASMDAFPQQGAMVADLKKKIGDLTDEVTTLATKHNELNGVFDQADAEMLGYQTRLDGLDNTYQKLDTSLDALLKNESLFGASANKTAGSLDKQKKSTKEKATESDKLAESLLDAAIAEQDLLDKNYELVDSMEAEIEALKNKTTQIGLVGEQETFWNKVKEQNIALSREQADALVKEKHELEQYHKAMAEKTAAMSQLWSNMAENMQRAFGDLIYDNIQSMLSDGELTFKNFTDTLLDMFIRMLADMAAKAAAAQILKFFTGSSGGFSVGGAASAYQTAQTGATAVSNSLAAVGTAATAAKAAYAAYSGSIVNGATAAQSAVAAYETAITGGTVKVYALGEATQVTGTALIEGAEAAVVAEKALEGAAAGTEVASNGLSSLGGAAFAAGAAIIAAKILYDGWSKAREEDKWREKMTDDFNQLRTATSEFEGEYQKLNETMAIVGSTAEETFIRLTPDDMGEFQQELLGVGEALREVGAQMEYFYQDDGTRMEVITGNVQEVERVLLGLADTAKVAFKSLRTDVETGFKTVEVSVRGNMKVMQAAIEEGYKSGALSAAESFRIIEDEYGGLTYKLTGDTERWASFLQSKGMLASHSIAQNFDYMESSGTQAFGELTYGASELMRMLNNLGGMQVNPTVTTTYINRTVNQTVDGTHQAGLSYVPYDGYIAELHKGERVMTAAENKDEAREETSSGMIEVLTDIRNIQVEMAGLLEDQVNAVESGNASVAGNVRR